MHVSNLITHLIYSLLQGDLFTGALFIQQSLKWDLYLCIFILVTITGIMTMAGMSYTLYVYLGHRSQFWVICFRIDYNTNRSIHEDSQRPKCPSDYLQRTVHYGKTYG